MRVYNTTYPTRQDIDGDLGSRGYIVVVGPAGMVLRMVDLTVDMAGPAAPYGMYIIRDRAGDFDGGAWANGDYPGVVDTFDADPDGIAQLDVWCAAGGGVFSGAFEFDIEIEVSPGVWESLEYGHVSSIVMGSPGAADYLSMDVEGVAPPDFTDTITEGLLSGDIPALFEIPGIAEALGLAGPLTTIDFRGGADALVMGLTEAIIEYPYTPAGLALGAGLDSLDLPGIHSRLGLRALQANAYDGIVRVGNALSFHDVLAIIGYELAAEGVVFGDSSTYTFTAISPVVDRLVLSGAASSVLDAINSVIAAIGLRTLADMFAKEQITDGVAINAAISSVLVQVAQIVNAIMLADIPAHTLTMGVVVNDGIDMTAAPGAVLEAMSSVQEGISLVLRMNVDGDERLAWVLNTDTKQATSYQNYPFNSFAKIDGEYFGMEPHGIRDLEGTTDDGDPINWRLRLAMTNLGSGAEKRMQAAYLAYASNGALLLKVIVAVKSKVVGGAYTKEAHWYRLNAQPSETPVQARLQIGQGLKTVYWGFGLEAIDGASLQADLLHLLPIVLDTYMQDEGGGKR